MAYAVQLNDERPGRTGHNRNGGVSTPHREPQGVVWLGAVPRSTRSRVPRPRADQKTCSAEQTLPRISPGPRAQPNTHRDRRGPWQLTGRALRPSTRPARPQPLHANRRSRQGRSAGDISAFYHEANVAITTILLEHYLCMQRAQAPRSNRPPSLPAATPANVLRAPEAFARTATNACMK